MNRSTKRSWVILFALAALDSCFRWESWPYGIKYDGLRLTVSSVVLNVIALAVVVFIGARATKRPSWASNLVFHWVACLWLLVVAFPWLGEKP